VIHKTIMSIKVENIDTCLGHVVCIDTSNNSELLIGKLLDDLIQLDEFFTDR